MGIDQRNIRIKADRTCVAVAKVVGAIVAHVNGALFLISGEISHVDFRLAR